MIKAILFDIGDVYFYGNFKTFVSDACSLLELSEKDVSSQGHPLNKDLFLGKIRTSQAFREFFKTEINDKKMETLLNMWMKTYWLNPHMRDLALKLKENYKVALLSNSDGYLSSLFERDCRQDGLDGVFLSHELGMMKPNKEIYLHAAENLGVKTHESLFVDDMVSYLEGAKKVGMNTLLFESQQQLERDLRKLKITF